MKIAVIDGDSICYLCSKDTIEESITNVNSIIDSMLEETESTHYWMFLSDGPYFRHEINSDYKGNKPSNNLKFLKSLKAYLRERFNAVSYDGLEADDLIAYILGKKIRIGEEDVDLISCAIDKDVIRQVPGTHYNYRTRETIETSEKDAYMFIYAQTLAGDSTDNIKGIPGIGEGKAGKLLLNEYPADYSKVVLLAYINHFKNIPTSIFEFQKNFRQVYLLRTDDDFLREVNYIPEISSPELIQ